MKYKRSNKHYTNCLTAEQASRMGLFLTMLTGVKRTADKLDKNSNVDLGQMVEAYRLAVG